LKRYERQAVSTGLEPLLQMLHTAGVKFVLIGGLAAVAHGAETVTGDVDICYARDRENLERLVQALVPLHPRLRGAPPDLPFRLDVSTLRAGLNFTLTTDLGDLDLLGEVVGMGGYESIYAVSQEMEMSGRRYAVITLEGLIHAKRAARSKMFHAIPFSPHTGQALDMVTVITTWPVAATVTNASWRAANTTSAVPVTTVLMGPTCGCRSRGSKTLRTASIAGLRCS
jgi:hypothetical protein